MSRHGRILCKLRERPRSPVSSDHGTLGPAWIQDVDETGHSLWMIYDLCGLYKTLDELKPFKLIDDKTFLWHQF